MAHGPHSSNFQRQSIMPLEPDESLSPEIAGLAGNARWMVPYADLLTLLLGYFLVFMVVAQPAKMPAAAPVVKPKAATVTPQKPLPTPKPDALEALVKQQFQGKKNISVHSESRGLVISLPERLLFGAGSAALTAGSQNTLNQVAAMLSDIPQLIRVEGHTDNTPITTHAYPSNWELSTARATHIVKALVTQYKLNPRRLSAAGYGEYKPIAENSSIKGKQKNRRVDIVILNAREAASEPIPTIRMNPGHTQPLKTASLNLPR